MSTIEELKLIHPKKNITNKYSEEYITLRDDFKAKVNLIYAKKYYDKNKEKVLKKKKERYLKKKELEKNKNEMGKNEDKEN